MAAITPHLEEYDSDEDELEYAECSQPSGLGSLSGRACPTPLSIVEKRHGNLVRMTMTRQALEEEIAELGRRGFSLRAQFGDAKGANKNELFLVLLDREGRPGAQVGSRGPEWNSHLEKLGAGGFKALSWTSKMDAPSFSLPSGANEQGGSCRGATAGQTTSVQAKSFVPMADLIRKRTGYDAAPGSAKWFADSVCESCYAGVGNYAYSSKQLAASLLLVWTRQSIKTPRPRAFDGAPSSEFVELMVEAIDRAEYVSDRLSRANRVRFFRIHDSGDFFSPAYLKAWKEVANRFLPGNPEGRAPVVFWAPTRIWATPWGDDAVRAINASTPSLVTSGLAANVRAFWADLGGNNLVIRPSVYHINMPAPPALPGYAAGSTVTAAGQISANEQAGAFEWNCPAYNSANAKHSCTASVSPSGEKGCRACWVLPEMTINYKLH